MSGNLFVPRAYQPDVAGVRVVVEEEGTNTYFLLVPPRYDIQPERAADFVLAAAIGKHGFVPLDPTKQIPLAPEELPAFLKTFA